MYFNYYIIDVYLDSAYVNRPVYKIMESGRKIRIRGKPCEKLVFVCVFLLFVIFNEAAQYIQTLLYVWMA